VLGPGAAVVAVVGAVVLPPVVAVVPPAVAAEPLVGGAVLAGVEVGVVDVDVVDVDAAVVPGPVWARRLPPSSSPARTNAATVATPKRRTITVIRAFRPTVVRVSPRGSDPGSG
jgi:hypothetical protein